MWWTYNNTTTWIEDLTSSPCLGDFAIFKASNKSMVFISENYCIIMFSISMIFSIYLLSVLGVLSKLNLCFGVQKIQIPPRCDTML